MRKVESVNEKNEVQPMGAGDVEMAENGVGEDDAGSVMRWSKFYTLSPLAEKLLDIEVGVC